MSIKSRLEISYCLVRARYPCYRLSTKVFLVSVVIKANFKIPSSAFVTVRGVAQRSLVLQIS